MLIQHLHQAGDDGDRGEGVDNGLSYIYPSLAGAPPLRAPASRYGRVKLFVGI